MKVDVYPYGSSGFSRNHTVPADLAAGSTMRTDAFTVYLALGTTMGR